MKKIHASHQRLQKMRNHQPVFTRNHLSQQILQKWETIVLSNHSQSISQTLQGKLLGTRRRQKDQSHSKELIKVWQDHSHQLQQIWEILNHHSQVFLVVWALLFDRWFIIYKKIHFQSTIILFYVYFTILFI